MIKSKSPLCFCFFTLLFRPAKFARPLERFFDRTKIGSFFRGMPRRERLALAPAASPGHTAGSARSRRPLLAARPVRSVRGCKRITSDASGAGSREAPRAVPVAGIGRRWSRRSQHGFCESRRPHPRAGLALARAHRVRPARLVRAYNPAAAQLGCGTPGERVIASQW